MLQPSDSQKSQSSSNQSFAPPRAVAVPVEQATIGRSLVVKGEISGSESLYIDGKVEGTINLSDSRVTIGRNGSVAASISAREVVILGKVHGNIQVTDRLDIRSEGSLTGEVITQRISVEDELFLKAACRSAPSNTRMLRDRPSQHRLSRRNRMWPSSRRLLPPLQAPSRF